MERGMVGKRATLWGHDKARGSVGSPFYAFYFFHNFPFLADHLSPPISKQAKAQHFNFTSFHVHTHIYRYTFKLLALFPAISLVIYKICAMHM